MRCNAVKKIELGSGRMEQTMKPFRFAAIGILGLIVSFYSLGDAWSQVTNGENHCFNCHTNPGKLIQITREIAKTRKGKQVKSAAIQGEG
jgi:hypothetical protein